MTMTAVFLFSIIFDGGVVVVVLLSVSEKHESWPLEHNSNQNSLFQNEMELVKSGVTDMEEKVIYLINHISLTHLVHFISHTNLTQAYITYKSTNCTGLLIQQTWALYQIGRQGPVLDANLLVEHLEHLDPGTIPV